MRVSDNAMSCRHLHNSFVFIHCIIAFTFLYYGSFFEKGMKCIVVVHELETVIKNKFSVNDGIQICSSSKINEYYLERN